MDVDNTLFHRHVGGSTLACSVHDPGVKEGNTLGP